MHPEKVMAPGLGDPVAAGQIIFRQALTAMSRPATARKVDFYPLFRTAPPLPMVTAALVMTLADSQTPLWLSPSLKEAQSWLNFHLSAEISNNLSTAQFVVCGSPEELPRFSELTRGTDRRPDLSATVIISKALNSPEDKIIAANNIEPWAWGPGLKNPRPFSGPFLTPNFWSDWQENTALYPMGVDVFLTGDNLLAGLPRSVRLGKKPKASNN
ncbi:MAG: phosphonate C-P lyase system protein PhnH [Deltaproteobacteria bacterium]|jgi:alpha-D-ribose 1-methylphosphonate 5-triphosphate synthase subunit PhnH|nr:phosphonate C-P lyase system protein PhnH [Deltaproteobacteria bacterium]